MKIVIDLFFFFFSSRRRHTRFDCDWSSDVCSSDLARCRLWRRGLSGRGGTGGRSRGWFASEVDVMQEQEGADADGQQQHQGCQTAKNTGWNSAGLVAMMPSRELMAKKVDALV